MAADLRKSKVTPGRSAREVVVRGPKDSRQRIEVLSALLDEPVAMNSTRPIRKR